MKRTLPALLIISAFVAGNAVARTGPDNPEHVAAFMSTKNCPGCDLQNARLGGVQAPGAQLMNADLSDASLYGANLRGADLTGAILDRANLEMADLTGAVGALLQSAQTDQRTTCPDGSAGPCR